MKQLVSNARLIGTVNQPYITHKRGPKKRLFLVCRKCHGSGEKKGKTCPACEGKGIIDRKTIESREPEEILRQGDGFVYVV